MNKKLVVFLLSVSLVFSFIFLNSCNQKAKITEKNKTIASNIIHEAMETGVVDSKFIDPEVELEFPADFKFPPLGVNKVKGIEALEKSVKAWKVDTAHEVDVLDIIGEGDKVVVVLNVKRVVKLNQEEHVYKDHIYANVFEFKEGKIIKIRMIFDVIDHIEQHKAEKYGFKKEK